MRSTDAACILVVDDDTDVREALLDALKDEGYRAAGWADGAHAVSLIKENRSLQLVLLDWNMAPMSGLEVVEHLRREHVPIPPVVVFTADPPKDKVARIGAVGFLKKPVPLDDLFDLATRYCPKRQ
jgi:two-component system, chemotaxis family, chemotaxis protein CheY